MTQDALCRSLETETLPAGALRAAVPQAALLAPAVLALAARPSTAPMLLVDEQRLLHRGLHVLAAARHSPGFRPLVDLLTRPYAELVPMLGPQWEAEAPSLLLGLFDGDPAPLFTVAGDTEAPGLARWAVLLVLTRLVWQGDAPRAPLLDLLDRMDRTDPAPLDSFVWLGFQSAICGLGLTEWQDRVVAGWRAGRLPGFTEADKTLWAEKLQAAVQAPADDRHFAFEGAVPVSDPVVALERWSYPPPAKDSIAPLADPGQLSVDEKRWLEAFLWQGPLPGRTMSLEEADGFLTALAAGPVQVPVSQAVRRVLGVTSAHPPRFPTPAHAALTEGLIARHTATIAARLGAGLLPRPYLVTIPETEADVVAGLWCQGFARGAGLDAATWRRTLVDPRARGAYNLITGLIPPQGAPRPPAAAMPGLVARRMATVEQIPAAVRAIADAMRAASLATSLPAASGVPSFVGRNAPCPCGSGRKFKHCCGAITANT